MLNTIFAGYAFCKGRCNIPSLPSHTRFNDFQEICDKCYYVFIFLGIWKIHKKPSCSKWIVWIKSIKYQKSYNIIVKFVKKMLIVYKDVLKSKTIFFLTYKYYISWIIQNFREVLICMVKYVKLRLSCGQTLKKIYLRCVPYYTIIYYYK